MSTTIDPLQWQNAGRQSDLDRALDVMLRGARGLPPGTLPHRRGWRHLGRVADADDRAVAVQRLLDEVCDDLGFCLPPGAEARLRQAPPLDADGLTDAIFIAENMEPGVYPYLRQDVKAIIDRRLPSIVRS
jgi:hypothetical protein